MKRQPLLALPASWCDEVGIYDLYGVRGRELDDARRVIEEILGVELVAHESGYHCGNYYRGGSPNAEHFILQMNYDDLDDEWTEPDHKDVSLLLFVNDTHRSEDLKRALTELPEVTPLKHQEIEAPGAGLRRELRSSRD